MARKGLYLAITAVIGAVALGAVTRAADEPSGPPLTKEQYFQKVIDLSGKYSKTTDRYYAISLKLLPAKRCARLVRRYAGSLSPIVEAADDVIPPAEIAETHENLVDAGGRVVRKIRKTAQPVAKGKLRCGAGKYPKAWKLDPARRIDEIYTESPVEDLFEELRSKGYIPSGE